MALQPAPDVPLLVSSPNASSERRITPSWSIALLKTRLEPITGIPAQSQRLALRVGSQDAIPLAAPDEETTLLSAFPLQAYAEITVSQNHRVFSFDSPLRARSMSGLTTVVVSLPATLCCLRSWKAIPVSSLSNPLSMGIPIEPLQQAAFSRPLDGPSLLFFEALTPVCSMYMHR
jgi:hypothetical protein